MPCLFVLLSAFAPRIALIVLWLFTPYVNAVFDTWPVPWLWPILGIIFLPFTTLMYVLVAAPLGQTNIWGWLCVVMGVLIDLRSYNDAYENRAKAQEMAGMSPTPSAPAS